MNGDITIITTTIITTTITHASMKYTITTANINNIIIRGRGFVAEVDYRLEAINARTFIEAMERRGLNAVTAPAVIENLSGSKVIVTEWVQGTRLDRDASPDIPRLCSVAVNAYLTMLLDTGCLHCDPHVGNLLVFYFF